MRWILCPNWSDAIARRLHNALADAFYQKDDLIEVWLAIGMHPADEDWEGPARQIWVALTRDAAIAGCLEKLILEVRHRRPALAQDLDAVLAAELATDSWYGCDDPFMSRLVGPGNLWAILDRYGLRAGIRDLAKQNFPVLSIQGRPGSGRSYSRRVLQHVSEYSDTRFELIIVDAATDLRRLADAKALLTKLAARVGLQITFDDIDLMTEANSRAQEMAGDFVDRFRQLPSKRRWIFLDSLDRPHVQDDLHAAVGYLASEIEKGQLGPTRLIVTGHYGDFPPEVLDILRQENIHDISDPEVRAFFREVAEDIGRIIEESELDNLVANVRLRAAAGSLHALGKSASDVAHEYFGGEP